MTNIPTKDELKKLTQAEHGDAVSIYLPTHEAGPDTRENAIRFKNRVQDAENRLNERGYDDRAVDKLLGPAQALIDDNNFWQHQRKGLAVFVSEGENFQYRLPIVPEELTVVSDRFHFKPLLPLLTGDGRFYILAVTLNSVRLLEATRYNVSEVELEDAPTSMEDALRFDDDAEPTSRAFGTGGRGGDGTSLQFQGAEEDDRNTRILRFFTALDTSVRKFLDPQGAQIPLVFVGNVTDFPIYQKANHYQGLLDTYVDANPEVQRDEALHERAWELVAPHFSERRERDAESFMIVRGEDAARASADLKDVLPASYDHRIETLFVPLGQQQWGRYDADARIPELYDDERTGSYDLYDLAAVHTLLNGGTVYVVDPEEIPGGGDLAAVYRF